MSFTSEHYTEFLETLDEPCLVLDDDLRVVVCNAAAREVFGVAPGAPSPMPLAGPLDEPRYVRVPGALPWLAHLTVQPVRLDGRERTLVRIRRLTGEPSSHAELVRGEEVLRQAAALLELGVFEHDHRTGALHTSPELRSIYGWRDAREATLEAFLACAYAADAPRVWEAVRRAHDPAGDGVCDVEGRLVRPDGEIRWVRTRSRTFFRDGALDRTVGAIVDVTRRHLDEEERHRLVALLEATPDLVALVRPDRSFDYLNQSARARLCLTADEPADVHTIDRLGPATAARLRDGMRAATEVGSWSGEMVLATSKGKDLSWSVLIQVHRDGQGDPQFWSLLARELTELRALEDQLRQAQKLEALGRLAGGLAHDFNNLLTVILGYVDVVLADAGPRTRDDLGQIRRAAERASELTRQMLAFSRKQVLRPVAVDLGALLAEMLPMLRRLVGETVVVRTHTPEVAAVRADPTQLEQVVLNLVINARDAMPDGGTLRLELGELDLDASYAEAHLDVPSGRYVMLAVSDNGCGMDAPTLARVFEPFFTTKGPGLGTGLGLATVFGIVKQSGGHLWVYSEPGVGTTFKVYLPVTGDRPARAVAPPSAPGATRTATILVVEDDEAVRRLLVAVLTRAGHRVLDAGGPQTARTLAASHPGHVDLLVTDVVMPNINGRELAAAMTAERPGLCVLYISGYTEHNIVDQGVLEPGAHFLAKPIVPGALLAAVARILA